MAILHQVIYQVSHGTSPLRQGGRFQMVTVSISGKTGTAESYVAGGQVVTNAVAYAPTENPQIAVAVFPHNTNLTKNVGPAITRTHYQFIQPNYPMN